MNYEHKLTQYWFFLIAIVLTNITQMPTLISIGVSKYLIIVWGIIGFLYISKRYVEKTIGSVVLLMAVFTVLITFLQLATNNNYFGSSLTKPFYISCMMLILGLAIESDFTDRKDHYLAYYLSTVVLMMDIFQKYLIHYDWNNLIYVYASKNSVSQIILTALVIGILIIKPQKRIIKYAIYFVNIIMVIILFMLRSRASLIGLVVLFIFIVFTKNSNKWLKRFAVLGGILFICLLFAHDSFFDFIINNIVLNNRNISNLNAVTSNRWDMFLSFPNLFNEHILVGRGDYYIESFFLLALLQYGLPVGLIVIGFALAPLIWAVGKVDYRNNEWIFYLVVTISYLLNGVFEAQAPLGPGVKCYWMWLMFGAYIVKWRKGDFFSQ